MTIIKDEEKTYKTMSFNLSLDCIKEINKLAMRFSKEAKFTISRGKIIELAIGEIKDLSLVELLTEDE